MGVIKEVIGAGTLVGLGLTGFIFMDDRHVHVADNEAQNQELMQYMQNSERRAVKRDIRSLKAISDDRPLTANEKRDLRELEDDLKAIDGN